MIFLILIGVVIVFLLFIIVSYLLNPIRHLPGPKVTNFVFGNIKEVRAEPFMAPHTRWWKENGYPKLMRYFGILLRPSLLIFDPELIKQVMGKDYTAYPKRLMFLSGIIGDGLVTLDGPDWVRHRRLIQPSFNVRFIERVMDENVPARVDKLVNALLVLARRDEPVSVNPLDIFMAITLDIISSSAFSFHAFSAVDKLEQWVQHPSNKMALLPPNLEMNGALMFPNLREMMFLGFNKEPPRVVASRGRLEKIDAMDQVVNEIVSGAKERVAASGATSNSESKAKSILELLVASQEADGLSDTEFVHEVKTFLFAGHETTSNLLNWAVFSLLYDCDASVEKRLVDEIQSVVGASERVGVEHVSRMPILGAFVQELLRFHPPVGLIIRRNANDTLLGEQRLQKMTRIVLPIHLIHRHPEHWERADEFWLDRWLQPDFRPTPWAFIPFGGGARSCIGNKFALLEAKLILAGLLRKLTFRGVEKKDFYTHTSFVTVRPKPDLKVIFEERK